MSASDRLARGFWHRPVAWLLVTVLTSLFAPSMTTAQPYPVPPTWGGDILSRQR